MGLSKAYDYLSNGLLVAKPEYYGTDKKRFSLMLYSLHKE